MKINKAKNYFWIENLINEKEAREYLEGKNEKINNLKPVYFYYRVYKYTAKLKRLFLAPKYISQFIMVNIIDGNCSPIQIDVDELKTGQPEGEIIEKDINIEEYNKKSEKEMLFFILKRYFVLQTPEIECEQVYDIYFPYWQFAKNRYLNARRIVIEEIETN